MAKLLITWSAPEDTRAIDSIVLYRKNGAADCEETLQGEEIYETTDLSSQGCRYIDEGLTDGNWRYGAFSKNEAGLSPCATSVYSIVTDVAPTVGSPLPDITAWDGSQDMTISLSSVFVDSDGDAITKTVTSSDSNIVSASINGDDLVLSFISGQVGTVTITVTGQSNGKTVTDQFTVDVTDGIPVNMVVSPKFQGHNELSFEFAVTSTFGNDIASVAQQEITAPSSTFVVELSKDSQFNNIFKTDTLSNLPGINVASGSGFNYIHFFDQLDSETNYWARMTISGGLTGAGSSLTTTPTGFLTNPCQSYTATRNLDNSISITGTPGSQVTVTEELAGQEGKLRGHVRVLAVDESMNVSPSTYTSPRPWIAVGENSQGGGKMIFDTGWGKFIGYSPEHYNSLGEPPVSYPDTTVRSEPVTGTGWDWNNGYSTNDNKNLGQGAWWEKGRTSNDSVHTGNFTIRPDEQGGLIQWKQSHKSELVSGASIYDESKIPAWAGYLYNAIRYMQRKTNRTNKVLYINDYKNHMQYGNVPGQGALHYFYLASQKFFTTFRDISEHAGLTFEQLPFDTGPGNTWYHGDKLTAGFKNSEAEWKAYLDNYDCVIYLGSEPNPFLPDIFINALLSFVDDGGGLMVTTDHDFGHGTVNQIVYNYGVQFHNNIDRTIGHEAYKVSTIISNAEYIPFGSHPLLDGISPNNHIHVGVSEGALGYPGEPVADRNWVSGQYVWSNSVVPGTPISKTSTYTIDSNGNLTITSHNDNSAMIGGKALISTADDCGSIA